jgi:hypothetical protein
MSAPADRHCGIRRPLARTSPNQVCPSGHLELTAHRIIHKVCFVAGCPSIAAGMPISHRVLGTTH